jgi:hypothetical protein
LTALFALPPGDTLTSDKLFLASSADVLPGEGVVILNSYPKAGRYTDSKGNEFGYGITRTTLINVSENSLQLTINFPADSFALSSVPGSNVKVFISPDTISFDEMPFDHSSWYAHDGLKPFLMAGLRTPTTLHDTINANQDRVFYFGARYQKTAGVPRAELILKGDSLFFRPSRLDPLLIPCGKIIFKK